MSSLGTYSWLTGVIATVRLGRPSAELRWAVSAAENGREQGGDRAHGWCSRD
ncbi:hypothetical protein STRIP9103_00237 [Streptomyces ipomoeae 91-03]|uniref:Uncharacterized protein n=1 Tax=Streptomyces ipomoeae 91-03 TaxID=698759 RepID=L1KQ63_9ACTN|nr:hypothetical protein STRIP9103_00237 [Streptomyces ipomoeae 91-03]